MNWKKLTLATITIVILGMQLVPYGRNHTNPPVRQEPVWDRPETRVLAQRACFDCHSNETRWPWYANIAPVSWLTQRDVSEGRQKLNFSEWNRPQDEANEAAEVIRKGEMPQWFYVLVHRDAKLSPAERELLIAGLQTAARSRNHPNALNRPKVRGDERENAEGR